MFVLSYLEIDGFYHKRANKRASSKLAILQKCTELTFFEPRCDCLDFFRRPVWQTSSIWHQCRLKSNNEEHLQAHKQWNADIRFHKWWCGVKDRDNERKVKRWINKLDVLGSWSCQCLYKALSLTNWGWPPWPAGGALTEAQERGNVTTRFRVQSKRLT